MKSQFFLGAIVLFVTTQLAIPVNSQSKPVACRHQLAQKVEAIINRPQYRRSHWGIAIQDLATEDTIYTLDSDKFFIPASTVKLLTTAAALQELGADFRITTPIYATGELPHLDTVSIQGKGDPTITSEILKNIIQQFEVLGIRSIKKLIIDDSYFAQPVINPTWEWADTYYYYATGVNSVILNENTVELKLVPRAIGQPVQLVWSDRIASDRWQIFNQGVTTLPNTKYSIEIDGVLGKPVLNIRGALPQDKQEDVWDLAVVDPANYFLETFRNLLEREGITVTQGIVVTEAIQDKEERIITQMYSPSLGELIIETNRESNNLYAEVLLKILAKELNIDEPIEALEISLNKLDISSNNYSLEDASGLSRQNLITPETLIQILSAMANNDKGDIYQSSLALAGTNGTLKNRFIDTELQNNLWGKTGSLSGVVTLAGYLKLDRRKTLAISILVNNFDDKNQIVHRAIDEIILLLPQFENCFRSQKLNL